MWTVFRSYLHPLVFVCLCARIVISTVISKKQQVCIIGAGATGLASAKQLAEHPNEFDFLLLERNSDIGGVWIYSETTNDEDDLPVHSSMYKNLRTNLPKELMAFPDYKNFSDPENRSCVTHETVLSYLKNYTDYFNLRQFIQFKTLVLKVTPIVGSDEDWHSTQYRIIKKNLNTNEISEMTCDAVIVCNGHYFNPRIPKIPGIESFVGTLIHSHVYRKPEVFNGQNIAVLGASFSGIDIGIEIAKYAKTVYMSHNKNRIDGLPDNVIQVAGVIQANGSDLILKDGSTIKVDALVLCTGYIFTYPFLDKDSGIKVDDNHVIPLYKHLINVNFPSMSFMGLPLLVAHFPLFYCQAKYFVALLQGKVALPSKHNMSLDSEVPEGKLKRYAHLLGTAQWDYNDDLAKSAAFEPLPNWYRQASSMWMSTRAADVWHYKDNNMYISDNGNVKITKPLSKI